MTSLLAHCFFIDVTGPQVKLNAAATGHSWLKTEWLKLRWGCQLCTMVGTHRGDPYDRSQRVLVFVNAILISVVVNILFFDVMEAPECCVCSHGVCGNRTEEPNGTQCAGFDPPVAEGADRARSYHRVVPPPIRVAPYSRTYSVPFFLKRRCDRRTLGLGERYRTRW